MKINEIETLVPNFSNDVLKDFETTQSEFKSEVVQQGFKILERRKMNIKMAEKKDFWERFTHNVEKLTLQFRTILKEQGNNPKKQERINQFFNYYDKEIKS